MYILCILQHCQSKVFSRFNDRNRLQTVIMVVVAFDVRHATTSSELHDTRNNVIGIVRHTATSSKSCTHVSRQLKCRPRPQETQTLQLVCYFCLQNKEVVSPFLTSELAYGRTDVPRGRWRHPASRNGFGLNAIVRRTAWRRCKIRAVSSIAAKRAAVAATTTQVIPSSSSSAGGAATDGGNPNRVCRREVSKRARTHDRRRLCPRCFSMARGVSDATAMSAPRRTPAADQLGLSL